MSPGTGRLLAAQITRGEASPPQQRELRAAESIKGVQWGWETSAGKGTEAGITCLLGVLLPQVMKTRAAFCSLPQRKIPQPRLRPASACLRTGVPGVPAHALLELLPPMGLWPGRAWPHLVYPPFVTSPVWGDGRGCCALPGACMDLQPLGAPCTELPGRLFLITFNCRSFLPCPSWVLKK